MPVPVKDPLIPTDKCPNLIVWYRLETTLIAVNLAFMNYVLLTAMEQEHCILPL